MRLSLCVLLVTLALCCYEANARVCPARMSELRSFFVDSVELYHIHLLKFAPPRGAAESMVKVKQCVDHLPIQRKQNIYSVLEQVASKCNS